MEKANAGAQHRRRPAMTIIIGVVIGIGIGYYFGGGANGLRDRRDSGRDSASAIGALTGGPPVADADDTRRPDLTRVKREDESGLSRGTRERLGRLASELRGLANSDINEARVLSRKLAQFLFDHPEAVDAALQLITQFDYENRELAARAATAAIGRLPDSKALLALFHVRNEVTSATLRASIWHALGQPKSATAVRPARAAALYEFSPFSAPISSGELLQAMVSGVRRLCISSSLNADSEIFAAVQVLGLNQHEPAVRGWLLSTAQVASDVPTNIRAAVREAAVSPVHPSSLPSAIEILKSDFPPELRGRAAMVLALHGAPDDLDHAISLLDSDSEPLAVKTAVLAGLRPIASRAAELGAPMEASAERLFRYAEQLAFGSEGLSDRYNGFAFVRSYASSVKSEHVDTVMQRCLQLAHATSVSAALRLAALRAIPLKRNYLTYRDELLRIVRDEGTPLHLRLHAWSIIVGRERRLGDAAAFEQLQKDLSASPVWEAFKRELN